jgi:hypothetical protein
MHSTRESYRIVRLANGTHSIHSLAHRETFHPVIGPVAEAEALYVKQLRLPERMANHQGEFVIWDVGLGAAANVLTVLRATRPVPCAVRVVSFDHTLAPLEFALEHAAELGYFDGYEGTAAALVSEHRVNFEDGTRQVAWELHLGDFPSLLSHAAAARYGVPPSGGKSQVGTNDFGTTNASGTAGAFPAKAGTPYTLPAPHAILFDAFSPAKNPAMWVQALFANLFRLLDPTRPCALPTYSRSTMLRVSLLLAGFYVGAGHATGEKEETTIAANTMELIAEPLDQKWLQRASNSTSAEPLWQPLYRQVPLSPETWEMLRKHRQFT